MIHDRMIHDPVKHYYTQKHQNISRKHGDEEQQRRSTVTMSCETEKGIDSSTTKVTDTQLFTTGKSRDDHIQWNTTVVRIKTIE